MIGIYLGAYHALHEYNIVYQDINGERDVGGDMVTIDLTCYDYIICTPPCNYYSRANWRRDVSEYSLNTRYLLPLMLYKLILLGKPFIVENVRNDNLFNKYGLLSVPCFIHRIGRHTYWTNVELDLSDIVQKPIVEIRNGKRIWLSSQHLPRSKRQGTQEVHEVVERFLSKVNHKEGG